MIIRTAQKRDIPRILELLVQVNMVHHTGRPDLFRGPATKYSNEELCSLLEDETRPIFVAVDETDRVLGHAFCIHEQIVGDAIRTEVRTLYIDDICVDETYRGQKIGKALYEHVLAYAREEGYYNVTLNVWACDASAMRFYEAMGMQIQKTGMEVLLDPSVDNPDKLA